jgi:drug/metabolite transporter (DMT)-like permease
VAAAALVGATAAWGSTVAATKDTLDHLDPLSLLAWRFGLAALVLLVVGWDHARELDREDRSRAVLLGTFLALGFVLQTVGLQETLAGVSGFLMGASIFLTPVAASVFFTEHVGTRGWTAVAAGSTGLALLAGGVTGGSLLGSVLTLGGAVGVTGHITGLSQWATPRNALGLTAWSVAVVAVLCALAAATTSGLSAPPDAAAWGSMAYLALVATCLGFAVQARAQSALTAAGAAVIRTMEPVFAAVIAWLAGERGLGPVGWAGGALGVGSMLLAALGPRECCDALAPRIECC